VFAWTATAHSGHSGGPQNPPHRRSAQLYLLRLGQAFAKVLVVETTVLPLGHGHHLLGYPFRRPSSRPSATVPVDNGLLATLLHPTPNPLHLTAAQPKHLRRFLYRHLAGCYSSYCI
jgi:hypothetical protein